MTSSGLAITRRSADPELTDPALTDPALTGQKLTGQKLTGLYGLAI